LVRDAANVMYKVGVYDRTQAMWHFLNVQNLLDVVSPVLLTVFSFFFSLFLFFVLAVHSEVICITGAGVRLARRYVALCNGLSRSL
jgi:hypothetical protein